VRASEATVVSRDFHPVPTGAHAAPKAAMVLSRIIEKEHTSWILAFSDEGQIAIRQEIAGGFRDRHKQMNRFFKIDP
jgi:hypothetical protein